MSLSGVPDLDDLQARSIAPPAFDCHYKWLGIPRSEQPPHHYRLLGIPRFTSDPEVIENAAQQRLMFLLTLQRGELAAEAQQLFDDVTAAKKCLLDASAREHYDRDLNDGTLPVAGHTDEPQASDRADQNAVTSIVLDDAEEPTRPFVRGRFDRPQSSFLQPLVYFGGIFISGIFGLVLGYLVITKIDPRNDFLKLFAKANPRPIAEVKEKEIAPPVERLVAPELPTEIRPVPAEVPAFVPQTVVVPSPVDLAPRESPPRLPSTTDIPEPSPAEQPRKLAEQHLGESLERGDLASILTATDALAKLENENPTRARLRVLETCAADNRISPASLTAALAATLEAAVAGEDLALAAPHVDRLLLAARQLNDPDLQRRATLIALKVRQGSEP